jgi:hypothetical protein
VRHGGSHDTKNNGIYAAVLLCFIDAKNSLWYLYYTVLASQGVSFVISLFPPRFTPPELVPGPDISKL